MSGARQIDAHYITAIRKLKDAGYITAALTNNTVTCKRLPILSNSWQIPPKDDPHLSVTASKHSLLKELLNPFLESSLIGLRKPNPQIYDIAIATLDLPPSEIIFLDDIGINLKNAKSRGLRTIKVNLGRTHEALEELEKMVGIPLFDKVHPLSISRL